MSVKEKLALVSPTEGSAPTWTAGSVTGSGSVFEVRAAAAFTPASWGILLPAMSTSFRRLEYTFQDGAQSSGSSVWAIGLEVLAFSSVNTFFMSMTNTAGTGQCDVRFNTTGTTRTVTIRNIANANAVQAGTAQYAINTKYRFELSCTIGGNIELRSYLWGSDTLIESITLAATSITQLTKAYMGVTAAAASWNARYADAPIYADAFVGSTGWAAITPLFTYNMGAKPWYASHRGAYGPEECAFAYQQSQERSPNAGWECDLQELSDGWALSHDDTLDRTADATSPFTTGSISALTKAQWATVKLKDLSSYGGGPALALTLDAWVALATGVNNFLIPEVKTGSNAGTAASVLIGFGAAPKAIVQAFSFGNATTLAAAGLETLFLMASGASQTWAQIKAAGINHVGRNTTLWTTPDITAAKAAGLNTWAFTPDTIVDRDTWLGNGIDAIYTDQPALLNPPAAARTSFMTAA